MNAKALLFSLGGTGLLASVVVLTTPSTAPQPEAIESVTLTCQIVLEPELTWTCETPNAGEPAWIELYHPETPPYPEPTPPSGSWTYRLCECPCP